MYSATTKSQENQATYHISSRTRASTIRIPNEAATVKNSDLEDAIPSRKRNRTILREPTKITTVKKLEEGSKTVSEGIKSMKERKERIPARTVKNEDNGLNEVIPPSNWFETYSAMKEMRTNGISQNAAVDTMGCERIAAANANPRDRRLHTLISLMLSSQTKDTTNAAAMNNLYEKLPAYKGGEHGLNLNNLLAVDPKVLNELIWGVGFHNNKTKYIKATAEILRDKWNSDIPDTFEGLVSLPGVGPKMAYLCLSNAWGRTEGIGVDVHVHRITNLWGWHKTKTPEETRKALQAWLPKEYWHEINWLLVGFGQTTCLPVGRKCGQCDLGMRGLCKSADRSKLSQARKSNDRIKAEGGPETDSRSTHVKPEEHDATTTIIKCQANVKAEQGKSPKPRIKLEDGDSPLIKAEVNDAEETSVSIMHFSKQSRKNDGTNDMDSGFMSSSVCSLQQPS